LIDGPTYSKHEVFISSQNSAMAISTVIILCINHSVMWTVTTYSNKRIKLDCFYQKRTKSI